MTIRDVYAGTVGEDFTVTVRASVELDAQVVQLSFDGSTWLTATWLGSAGHVRKAQVLLNTGNTPAAPATKNVYVKVDGVIFKAEGKVAFQPLT